MALLERSGNPDKVLQATDFTAQGDTKNVADDLALVVGCAVAAEVLGTKQSLGTCFGATPISVEGRIKILSD